MTNPSFLSVLQPYKKSVDRKTQHQYVFLDYLYNSNLNQMSSFTDQLTILEDYLKANKMTHTLQVLRQELASKIVSKPSAQLLALIDRPLENKQQPLPKKEEVQKKKPELLVDGLLGKIAYSSKILEDQAVNEKISKLLENKIFKKAVSKMFPEAANRLRQMESEEEYPYNGDELDRTVGLHSEGDGPSAIFPGQEDISILSQPSYVLEELQRKESIHDEYTEDNDLGYYQHDFNEQELMNGCARLTQKYAYPESAVKKVTRLSIPNQKPKNGRKFAPEVIFPTTEDKIYPLQYNGIIYNSMNIKVIHDRQKIGFEGKDIEMKVGTILMGRYEILSVLGSGVFATVVKTRDLLSPTQELACFKVVLNNKDFFDQSFDQIKFLRLIKANCDPDAHFLLDFKGAYYHKEHLFIQTDLLKDNLFSAYRKNPSFFSIPTIKILSRQILTALATLHSLNIVHSDLKPQNILIKSYSPVEAKIVDLGNACFIHDNLLGYVQSRSYRAPEVILGIGYDFKIDVWSVGCIIAQLWTKNVLFYNLHVPGMLARMQSIVGPWPEWMLESGSKVSDYFSKENLIFFEEDELYHILIPKKTSLRSRIRTDDNQFLSFLSALLQIDPDRRPTAQQALSHPFLQ